VDTTPSDRPDVAYRLKAPNCALLQVRTSAQAAIASSWLLSDWGIRSRFVYADGWYYSFLITRGPIPESLDALLKKRAGRRWISESERLRWFGGGLGRPPPLAPRGGRLAGGCLWAGPWRQARSVAESDVGAGLAARREQSSLLGGGSRRGEIRALAPSA